MDVDKAIPLKKRREIRNRQIKSFYRSGFSMDEVVAQMKRIGHGVSKTTVFFVINGRSKKADERNDKRKSIKKYIKNHIKKTNI